ncbi:methyl-accepting chemotaxis protein [Synechococcus sp. PCC 7336]|uniref:methyl-accepting chemotaxis protein n=1 Tax=Synechococcus sp. PCC 7336 TaxID=195250 RepID=UPI00034C1D3C|nr:methyl-accepting chemotaxis protein [Synechococcus sp. PCC 7336]
MVSHRNPELKPRQPTPIGDLARNPSESAGDQPRHPPTTTGTLGQRKAQMADSATPTGSSGSIADRFSGLTANLPLMTGLAIAAGVLPLSGLGLVAYSFASQGLQDSIITQQQANALETSNLFDTLAVDAISTRTRAISNLGIVRNPAVIENTTQAWKEALFQRFVDQGLSSVETVSSSEALPNVSAGDRSLIGDNSVALMNAAIERKDLYIASNFQNDVSGSNAIAAAIPAVNFETNEITGAVVTRLSLSAINSEFIETTNFLNSNLSGFEEAQSYAIDRDGHLLAGVEESFLGSSIDSILSCNSQFFDREGIYSEVCLNATDRQKYLVTHVPLQSSDMSEPLGWGIVVSQPVAAAFAPQHNLRLTFGSGIAGAGTLVGILGALLAKLLYRLRCVAEEQRQRHESIQQQVLSILHDIDGASQGDLTVRANVSDGAIGTVADFFNSIVESLRKIVIQVESAAGEVNASLGNDEESVRLLTEVATQQVRETTRTLESVETMTKSIQEVEESARQAAEVTRTVAATAETGGIVMDRTVKSIVSLRKTVAETAKKVKRLGESSQQISKVVSLIDEIGLQTNLLAINASIEAARAGEEGRGFAVVAEAVGKLAAQSANATKEIEEIVDTIQLETGEVVEAMEVGTRQVVEGTQLVEETKQSLEILFEASGQIDKLVQSISAATVSQTQTSHQVSELMHEIARISDLASRSSREVSESLQKTLKVADELQASVRTFKLDAESSQG